MDLGGEKDHEKEDAAGEEEREAIVVEESREHGPKGCPVGVKISSHKSEYVVTWGYR